MIYLKSIVIDRFKSFKHAELLFGKGFTCVVGPNGSGKSNICDSLLFGLGEGSLRRLRVNRLESLVTAEEKRRKETRKTYVRMEFGGDESITLTRAARTDGKTLYRLNGKRMTRQEVLEVLGKHGVRADETNTIAQGEINKYTELTPKERRELVDIASGIREFEYKKDEALKELEKVSQKINEAQIMLNERLGFLAELEAEKDAAEKYLSMGTKLKSINYGMLLTRKRDAATALASENSAIASLESRKAELSAKAEALRARISQSNQERQQLTGILNEKLKSSGETSAKLEAARVESARIGAELESSSSLLSELESTKASLAAQSASALSISEKNVAELSLAEEKLRTEEAELSRISAKLPQHAEERAREARELNASILDMEAGLGARQAETSRISSEISLLESRKDSVLSELESRKTLLQNIATEKDRLLSLLGQSKEKTAHVAEKIKHLEESLRQAAKETDALDSEAILLREQRSMAQQRSSGSIAERLGQMFGRNAGFYGKVSDLCSYDEKYTLAIEAAAGARFEYLVVDSLDTANVMIDSLKKWGAGRATFIPIKELSVPETKQEKGLKSLVGFVKFEASLSKVFQYVLGGTYLVDDIAEAKRLGVSRRRYATISGEIIEQSGIISGGSSARRVSLAQIESRLKAVEAKRSKLRESIAHLNADLLAERKTEAYAEMDFKSAEASLAKNAAENASVSSEADAMASRLKDLGLKVGALSKALSVAEGLRLEISDRLVSAKERLALLYRDAFSESGSTADAQASSDDLASLRSSVESLRIRKAELSKENQMLKQRISDIESELKKKEAATEELKVRTKALSERRDALTKTAKDIEAEISSASGSSKKLYEKLNKVDSDIAALSSENGKTTAEISNAERQISELSIKRGQLEVRINDLAVELNSYDKNIEPASGSLQEMEKEAGILSARIADLGNVNMKAPELFLQRKADVDEARSRTETLESERQAVMRMIEEIESKKLQTFMNTLNEVTKNFSKLFSYIFTEKASIELENPKDPFSSGIEIKVSTGKTVKLLSSMSGGEKSLISLVLIFSIHMCKPSAMYVFDEVDAALDKENSKKLSHLIKEMSSNAQFIVVSHNDSLIANADTAIGVVRAEGGSKAIGLEVSSIMERKAR